jgi:hypothetical protein
MDLAVYAHFRKKNLACRPRQCRLVALRAIDRLPLSSSAVSMFPSRRRYTVLEEVATDVEPSVKVMSSPLFNS